MPINTIIIEDEEKSLYVLHELIRQQATDLIVCGTASHTGPAVELIETNTPDLVFLDVRIADGTGFDVLRRLSHRNFELIFFTAYNHYALEAFRFAAIDYLLKPIGIQEFEEAVDRVRKRIGDKQRRFATDTLLHNLAQQQQQHKKINIATLNGYEFIELSNIVWCKSDNTYTTFYLTDSSKVSSSRNLGYYEDLLNRSNFCRIHHSVMINMQLIKSYVKGKGGYVIMADGTELDISQRRKGEFLDRLAL
ncbi:DNA-binding response regulator [Paraflavitalea soli]|uniref:DNA-binding response regulator n=1 Tax=Paraflavitalea soli TaxID=2315862 RepID=A0A3B7MJ38_9BACT|nr:LytTR family DNA-binding domain-containing protein [Paraflavitalea soli]AXY73249.1 DNA-binding response regulator [Paraflavitalea soli]